ncbi:hypothetical protein ACWEF9_00355 [Streptomyces sp. NPDC004980]
MVDSSRTALKKSGEASAQGAGAFANTGVIKGSVHLAAQRVAVSGYLLQVEAISAADFRGRDRELAALSSFCTDDDAPAGGPGKSYWRWLAPAWAGKSALLAKFALEPPPGVDIVSFFITSRLARQNDAAAFCEVVQRQLYSLLQEEEPLSTPHTRDEQLLLAINRAARLCATRGRRLVLVVDGLDEDRGVTPGPDCHSIAALLPRVPPHGMRVVVAGRPHPPVPGDVPADHPLRTAEIDHWLPPSSHAEAVRWDAEQDLLRLLDGGGPGRELVGLTVAAGGGLSARDLAELTGSRPRLVERELSAVSGRSFRRRSAHWMSTAPKVYLLAHEEIQRSAEELVTDAELSGYRVRLHTWAQTYRDAGWPATTPEYLLRGYTQLLRELREVRKLVVLSCDAQRHERLWQVTGADLEGLSELSACLDQLLTDGRSSGDQDVSLALRLAAARDRLHDRTANLPTGLIALWARLGHIDRAVGLAQSQGESYDRVAALTAVARVLAAAGHQDQAIGLADGADAPEDRDRFLEAIAKGLADAGQHAEATRTAQDIEGADRRAEALVAAFGAWAEAVAHGSPEEGRDITTQAGSAPRTLEAVAAVERMTNCVTQGRLFAALAVSLSQLGDDQHALAMAEQAVSVAGREPEAFRQAQTLARVARRMSAAPRLAAAAATIAVTSAEGVSAFDDPDEVDWLLPEIAAGLAATGQQDQAMVLVDRFLTERFDRDEGVCRIGIAAAEAGDLDAAVRLIEQIAGPRDRARVLNAVGEALAKSGDTARTAELARRNLEAVGDVADLGWQVQLLIGTADFLHRAGLGEQAHAVVTQATDIARDGLVPRGAVGALVEVAGALSRSGHEEQGHRLVSRAREIAEVDAHDYGRLMNLAEVAEGLYSTGRGEQAEELLSLLLDEVRQWVYRSERAEGMERVAQVFSDTGSLGRARELALEIMDLADSSDSPSRRSWDRHAAAGAFLCAADFDMAMALLADLPEDVVLEFRSRVVKRLVEVGDLDRAVQVAAEIADTREGERSLGFVAAGTAATGDLARASALLDEISTPVLRERSMPLVVEAMVRAGAADEARAMADAIAAPEHRSKALGTIAELCGPVAQGRVALVEALCLGPWDQLIREIAHVSPEHVPLLADLVLRGSWGSSPGSGSGVRP